MIGSNLANASGWTGQGVKVAIVDSGVDYTHPDLGGCFGAGCKVIGGWDFVGDSYDSNPPDTTYQPVPIPMRIRLRATRTSPIRLPSSRGRIVVCCARHARHRHRRGQGRLGNRRDGRGTEGEHPRVPRLRL